MNLEEVEKRVLKMMSKELYVGDHHKITDAISKTFNILNEQVKPTLTTKEGLKTHYVGIGICGLPVIQIQTDIEEDIWKLFKVDDNKAISLGKDWKIYELEEKT